MIDTIKLLIPIHDRGDKNKINASLLRFKKDDQSTGRVHFEFYNHSFEIGSHHRNIVIRSTEEPEGFFIEFSVPKYAKGNNVEMIYPHNTTQYFDTLLKELSQRLNFSLPHYSTWQIYRLDICYNWLFTNKEEAEYAMSFLQRIDFPRKQKLTYNTSVMYKGSAYSIKFYHKGAEFLKHDFKKIPEDQGFDLQIWADKIIRYEIGFKRNYLEKLLKVETVFLHHIVNDELIENLLKQYLDEKVFRYITPQSMSEASIEEILDRNCTKRMAMTLMQFYKNYYFDGSLKRKIEKGGMDKSTVYRYKKRLKELGIGSELSDINTGVIEKLIIPSPDTRFDLPISKSDIIEPLS